MIVTKSLPLDSEHFNFDLTKGFEMAVEKDWNVLDFTNLNDQLTIYDADLRPMQPSKYGIRIFYKACIPMCYVDPETYKSNPLVKTANNSAFNGKYLDLIDGTVIGSPVNKMSQGTATEQRYGEFGYHALLIDENAIANKPAYALPDDRALNHTNVAKWAFASGSSIASCKVDTNYYQPKDIGLYDDDVKGFAYMLMNKGGLNDGGVASFIVNNGALAYSIDTSANRFNIPTDDDNVNSYKYLQPALFVPFGVAFSDHLTLNNQETPVDTAGWFYCILGVNEVGGEDPSYQIDPQLIRLSNGEGLQIDTVAKTYSYSDNIGSNSGTFNIEIADYCNIVSITLNNESIQVPSPINNVYNISFSNLISGTNTLIVRTQDENEQALTYTFSLSYTQEPTTNNPDATFIVGFFDSNATKGFTQQTETGITSYSGTFSGDPSIGYLQLTVVRNDPSKNFTLTSYKINNLPMVLTLDGAGDYVAKLSGNDIPDPTNGYNIEIVLELDGDTYNYTITLTYTEV